MVLGLWLSVAGAVGASAFGVKAPPVSYFISGASLFFLNCSLVGCCRAIKSCGRGTGGDVSRGRAWRKARLMVAFSMGPGAGTGSTIAIAAHYFSFCR